MAGDKERRFKMRMASLARHPFSDVYHWLDWEARIIGGHDAEVKRIEKLNNKRKKKFSSGSYHDDDLAGEYIRARDISNNMYAALIVSIWSAMEYFLKSLARTCYAACEERKIPPHEFKDIKAIKEAIEKKTGIQLKECNSYATIDAARILCNSFKHYDGRYAPTDKAHTQIEKSLLEKWTIENYREIDYAKLSIGEVILACNAFCADLLKKVEAEFIIRFKEAA